MYSTWKIVGSRSKRDVARKNSTTLLTKSSWPGKSLSKHITNIFKHMQTYEAYNLFICILLNSMVQKWSPESEVQPFIPHRATGFRPDFERDGEDVWNKFVAVLQIELENKFAANWSDLSLFRSSLQFLLTPNNYCCYI